MPLISVILSVYNGSETIAETIKSVINQSFTDWELIIINDGSQDATLDVINSISDSRIQVFSHANSGQAFSNNRGLSLAKGEYISFIDADDLWTTDKLKDQLKSLQNNPEAAVAISWTDHIDKSGQFLRQGPHPTFNGDAYTKLLLEDYVGSGSNPLIRKQALDEVGNFEVSLAPAADWDLWLRLLAKYNLVVVPHVQILYRQQSAGSVTQNVLKMEQVSLKTLERAFANAPESLQHLKKICLANRYKYLMAKALENYPTTKEGLIAFKCFVKAILHNPSILTKSRFVSVLLIKILITIFLPKQSRILIENLKKLSA